MRRAMLIIAVMMALVGLAGNGKVVAQEGGFGANPIGEPVPIYNVDGDEVAQVTVDEVIDPFEDYEDFGAPAEGERFVLAAITVENTGERPYEFAQFDFYLLDSFGRAAFANFVSRTADSIVEYPDLESSNMNPGETVSGAVLYVVADDAELTQLYYSFFGDIPQLYALADLSGGTGGSSAGDEDDQAEETPDATDEEESDNTDADDTDDETPVADDEDDADDDSADDAAIEPTEEHCDWATDTLDRLNALQPVGAELQNMGDDVDIERLREIADQLADEADAQRESDPPAAAEEASDQIADALDTYADALDVVADAVEEDEVVDTAALLADIQDANALIEEASAVTAPLIEACDAA